MTDKQTKTSYHNYQAVDEFLGYKTERPINAGRSTVAIRLGDNAVAIKFKDTAIVTYFKDGSLVLSAGNWQTRITLNKINIYIPDPYAVVVSKLRLWKVVNRITNNSAWFYDGITIRPQGFPEFEVKSKADANVKSDLQAMRDIDEYVSAYLRCIEEGHLCDQPDIGKIEITAKELRTTVDYISQRQARLIINSTRYPPSVLTRAIYTGGAEAPFVIMASQVVELPKKSWTRRDDYFVQASLKCFKRVLRRFLRKSMGLPL